MNPQGQAAIVTGGGSGLGAQTAATLAKAGAKVAVFDINLEGAKEVAERIGGIAVHCDISDEKSAEAAIAAAREQHGPTRILINCAGIGGAKRIVGKDGAHPLGDFERVIKVNLIGTFNMLRLAATEMAKLEPLAEDDGHGDHRRHRLDRDAAHLRVQQTGQGTLWLVWNASAGL